MHADRPRLHRVLDALPRWSAHARALCVAIITFYLGLFLGLLLAPRPETAREVEMLQHPRTEAEAHERRMAETMAQLPSRPTLHRRLDAIEHRLQAIEQRLTP